MKKTGGNEEMTSLAGIPKIKAENIDVNAYFLSLTDQALDAGLLSDKDINDMQSQIYDIVSDNIWMYTKGTSTSVTSGEANEMVLEILYALDCFCLSVAEIPAEDKSADLINMFKEKAGIKKYYEQGLEVIKKTGKTSYKESEAGKINKWFDFEQIVDLDELADFEKEQAEHDINNKVISRSEMTDMDFNFLYNKILKCQTAEKKADLIIETVSSAADFLDILTSECLFGGEYLTLYRKLSEESPETIAFLAGSLDNADDEWQKYLLEFMGE